MSRVDHSISERNRLSARLSWNHRTEINGDTFNTLATGSTTERINKGAVIDDTITPTPTLVLNARFAWTRFEEPSIRGKSVGYDTVPRNMTTWFLGLGLLMLILTSAAGLVWSERLP